MDLQSILDASDSSDEAYSEVNNSAFRYAATATTTDHHHHHHHHAAANVDIEKILRESDDDDDDDDGVDDAIISSYRRRRDHRRVVVTADDILAGTAVNGYDDDAGDGATPSTIHSNSSSRHRPAHSHGSSGGDWDILQAILASDDDDDEVDDYDDEEWLSTRMRSQSFGSSELGLDHNGAFVVSGVGDGVEGNFNGSHNSKGLLDEQQRLEDIPPIAVPNKSDSNPVATNGSSKKVSDGLMIRTSTATATPSPFSKSSPKRISFYDPVRMKHVDERKQKIVNELTSDQQDEDISRRAQNFAHEYEQKLLKSGHRDMVSPLRVKRRLKQKIELKQRGDVISSSSTHPNSTTNTNGSSNIDNSGRISSMPLTRFGSSGIVENKTMERIRASIKKHSTSGAKVHCGLPTSIAFNSRFIAVGTQNGIILLYDLFEVLRQRLGATYDDNSLSALRAGSVTSVDLSFSGEAIIAGYSSGMVVLWDSIRGIVLRAVNDIHLSPIASVRFLNDLKVVTVDVGGLVNKLTFAKNLLWANYTMETECLLDGTAGQILAINVLPSYSTVKPQVRPNEYTPFLRKLTLLALSSERSSFTVAVEPEVNVLHRWTRPPSERIETLSPSDALPSEDSFLPCLAWGWALVAGGGNRVMPILARGWGCCLQLLGASFPTLESPQSHSGANSEQPQIHWPAFGVHREIDSERPIVALEWLDDRSLMFLTLTNELTLVDTVMMTLLERLDVSGLRLVYAEFTLSRNAARLEIGDTGNGVAPSTTFQNSIRYNDDRLMVLCKSEVQCISIVGARRRIASLEEDGEWLEALALTLDHYENTVISQEDRRRDQSGRKDLSRHPDFIRVKNDDEEWLAKLLVRYLKLAVENAPEASMSVKPYSRSPITPHIGNELVRSHYQMLAGVCIEFCVITRKAELLFGPIFEQFQSVGYTSIFLDVLEPYVLNDKMPYIGAEAMSFFVEHCKATNDIATVERCLLHMDCSIMDFDTILSLLRRNSMYTALFYVYNSGLDDYVTPLEIVLDEVFSRADAGNISFKRRADGVPQTDFERLGYKALLYLRTCFLGKTFPRENEIKPEDRRRTVRRELLLFLLREKYTCSPQTPRHAHRLAVSGIRALPYPHLRLLLMVDARGLLHTITLALDLSENLIAGVGSEMMDGWVQDGNDGDFDKVQSLQEIVQILAGIALPTASSSEVLTVSSRTTVNSFLDFATKYMMNGAVTVDRDTTYLVLQRASNFFTAADSPEERKEAQKKVMGLLSALPRESYDPDKVLEVIKKAGMHRSALLLHQQVASAWNITDSKDIELQSKHFQSAIDCYIGDEDPQFRTEVYAYVKKECSGLAAIDESDGSQPANLRQALFMKLSALCRLDALMTASLVADLFVDDLDLVVDALDSCHEDQFRFLHAIASGSLGQLDPVAGSVLVLQPEHYQKYLALMAKLHPEMVYDYLSTHDSYRTEECLALCEEYDIPDATVYLLERTDKVNDALRLGLQTLESRMMEMKRTVRGMEVDSLHQKYVARRATSRSSEKSNLPSKQHRAQDSLKRMLTVVLDVCERKSHAHGSKLWFTVLDRLINAKSLLRLSKEQPQHASIMSGVLSDLLRLIMQRMVSSVPLKDLVQKVTTDNSGSNLGEIREMVEGLLGTYNFELKVFKGAATVFNQDVRIMRTQHRRMCVQGSLVQSIVSPSFNSETTNDDDDRMGNHHHHHQRTLQVGGNATASFFRRDLGLTAPYTQRAESGLANTLTRVRAKRTERLGRPSGRSVGLNMMTETDIEYQNNEIEPVVLGPRPVGVLSETQHFGRLVLF